MPTLLDVLDVKKKHEDRLIRTKGIVGVGADRKAGKIVVYTESRDVAVPSTLEGVPVQRKVVGRLERF